MNKCIENVDECIESIGKLVSNLEIKDQIIFRNIMKYMDNKTTEAEDYVTDLFVKIATWIKIKYGEKAKLEFLKFLKEI